MYKDMKHKREQEVRKRMFYATIKFRNNKCKFCMNNECSGRHNFSLIMIQILSFPRCTVKMILVFVHDAMTTHK